MKGVIYARYSSDNQREESIEGQLRECKDYAERNGITILGTYIDRALSAKTDNRPEFQKMIKDSAKGLFDVVLVWKLDRFARNRYDSARYKNLLKKNGVKVISARENISEGSEGIILEAMLNIINLRLDITHLYYPAKNSFQKGRLKRREIFTELLLYTLTT